MSRRLGRKLVEVGVGEVDLDPLQEPVEASRASDINVLLCLASTASEKSPDTSLAINDVGAGVTWGRERAGPLVVRNNRPLCSSRYTPVR